LVIRGGLNEQGMTINLEAAQGSTKMVVKNPRAALGREAVCPIAARIVPDMGTTVI